MAQELGVDLSEGSRNRSRWNDQWRRCCSAPQSAECRAPGTARPGPAALSSIARLMAERTTQSWTTAPHFFLVREIDASGFDRRARETRQGDYVTPTFWSRWSPARW